MAYDATRLSCAVNLIGGQWRLWTYLSADQFSDVDATDYFANAYDAGMREGDWVVVVENDTDPPNVTLAAVNAIDADGNATVVAVAFSGAASFTTLTASGATTLNGNVFAGNAAADLVGFYGATGVSQRASSVMATTNIATSSDFGATQLATIQEIMNTLNKLGLHKGTA